MRIEPINLMIALMWTVGYGFGVGYYYRRFREIGTSRWTSMMYSLFVGNCWIGIPFTLLDRKFRRQIDHPVDDV